MFLKGLFKGKNRDTVPKTIEGSDVKGVHMFLKASDNVPKTIEADDVEGFLCFCSRPR